MDKKVLLSVKDLHVKFRVRGRILTAIRGIPLDFYEGESIAIVGESGSGKSVFTKTFAGMLDANGFIDQGSIIFHDEEKRLLLNSIIHPFVLEGLNRFFENHSAVKVSSPKRRVNFVCLPERGLISAITAPLTANTGVGLEMP